MDILCITHADFEVPGVIEAWALRHGHNFKIVRPYKGEKLPSRDNFDCLIVMGGPQSTQHLDKFPYLSAEIDLINSCIARNKGVLGFCLGAQLIGTALGAKTTRSPEKEVGVYPITLTAEGKKDLLLRGFPASFPAIHWHNDMPGITDSAVVLASSLGCPRQVVRYKSNVYGFQCHLEITHDGIKTMIEAVPEDLKPSKYTQTQGQLLAADYKSINNVMVAILDRFITL